MVVGFGKLHVWSKWVLGRSFTNGGRRKRCNSLFYMGLERAQTRPWILWRTRCHHRIPIRGRRPCHSARQLLGSVEMILHNSRHPTLCFFVAFQTLIVRNRHRHFTELGPCCHGACHQWYGRVAEVIVYNRSLSTEECQANRFIFVHGRVDRK